MNELGQVASQKRLAAGQPDLVHPEGREDVDERLDLLEVQDVLARQPHVVRLRHAVAAAQVAPVGDREPEVPQRALMPVEDHWFIMTRGPDCRLRARHGLDRPTNAAGRAAGMASTCAGRQMRCPSGPGRCVPQAGQSPSG